MIKEDTSAVGTAIAATATMVATPITIFLLFPVPLVLFSIGILLYHLLVFLICKIHFVRKSRAKHKPNSQLRIKQFQNMVSGLNMIISSSLFNSSGLKDCFSKLCTSFVA